MRREKQIEEGGINALGAAGMEAVGEYWFPPPRADGQSSFLCSHNG